jgi:hypothetical protein
VLLVQFVGDAFVGQADKLCERRVRPTRTARQRWEETGKRREGMAIDRPKVDGLSFAPAGAGAEHLQPLWN